MLNDPNEDPRDEDEDLIEDEDNRCGDVERESVSHLLVEDEDSEEGDWLPSW